ncbi:MAG: sigma-70 family RNA polymerase sigma factor, partial [Armatimonadetes bacterium]|nr:sigma-70 family RNA polymerase sigma factor [Armatimonadota bacterium]
AVDHFDPDRRVKFETYARHMIAGEIRHYLRDHAASNRRPRWLGTLNQRIARAVGTLHQRLGRPPTLREICGEAGVTEDTLLEVLKAREALRVLSLDENGDDGEGGMGPAWERTAGYEGSAAQPALDDRIVLMEAMDRLKPMQQRVLFWLFYRDLTQTEVAARLRISQKHVSRVMHAAIRNLKSILREE